MKKQYSSVNSEKTREALAPFLEEEFRSSRVISSSLETSVTRLKIGENFYFSLIFPLGLGEMIREKRRRMKEETLAGNIDTE